MRTLLAGFVLSFLAACSVPNLEPPQCTQARNTVQTFYSHHFDGDMTFSQENLASREKFLTANYIDALKKITSPQDVFTAGSTEHPRAFRVNVCEPVSDTKVDMTVLLFWRDDEHTEQRAINVETVLENGEWRIDSVRSK